MKIFLRIAKTVGTVLLALVFIFMLAVLSLNIAKYFIYPDYYARAGAICKNPGLSDGFICQGIGAVDGSDKIFVSGYMADGSASRIYVTDKKNASYYVSLSWEGEDFTGHLGGITVAGDKVYISSGGKIGVISLDAVLSASSGDAIALEDRIPTNNSASYIFSDENYLYVGEFHNGKEHVTDHPYTTPEGEHNAIIARYSLTDLTKPDMIYSVRDKVQGVCFTPDGKIILSTSYGRFSDSYYYDYNAETDLITSDEALDGAPVVYVSGDPTVIKGPAMAEGLDLLDGKVITLSEISSSKYFYGRFFFADNIVSLKF